MTETTAGHQTTVVSQSMTERVVMFGGFPVAGALLGWLLKLLAGWASTLPWMPLPGPLKLVASLPEPHATIGALAVGAVAGLVLAFIGASEELIVSVAAETVTLTRDDRTRTIAGGSVAAVFVDAKHLVLQDAQGRELVREKTDLGVQPLSEAFRAQGYSWCDADPYGDEFRPWVEASPDLSKSAHGLLGARRRAVEKDKKDDADAHAEELSKLGIVVRDSKAGQQWRQLPAEVPAPEPDRELGET